MSAPRVRVVFVCLGNICRSPTAEAVMVHLVREAGLADAIAVDSAGTGGWHVGEDRDERSHAVGRRRGMPLRGYGRHFSQGDFDRFDYVLAMDRKNLADLQTLARNDEQRVKVRLLRSFDAAAAPQAEVPDPYHGGPEGFEQVFDMCLAACRGLLSEITRAHKLVPRA